MANIPLNPNMVPPPNANFVPPPFMPPPAPYYPVPPPVVKAPAETERGFCCGCLCFIIRLLMQSVFVLVIVACWYAFIPTEFRPPVPAIEDEHIEKIFETDESFLNFLQHPFTYLYPSQQEEINEYWQTITRLLATSCPERNLFLIYTGIAGVVLSLLARGLIKVVSYLFVIYYWYRELPMEGLVVYSWPYLVLNTFILIAIFCAFRALSKMTFFDMIYGIAKQVVVLCLIATVPMLYFKYLPVEPAIFTSPWQLMALLTTESAQRDELLIATGAALFLLGFFYLLLPLDLIPDFIPFIGKIDDYMAGCVMFFGAGMMVLGIYWMYAVTNNLPQST